MTNSPEEPKKGGASRFFQSPAFRFVGLFLFYLVLLGAGYSQLSSRVDVFRTGLTDLTARLVGVCYSLGGASIAVSGNSISGSGVALSVIEECTGAYEMIIFSAAVLAFPAGWGKRGWGIFLGVPALFVINVFRMVLLAYVQAHASPKLFDFMHIYFWQATLILMILGVFILWIKLAVFRNVKMA